MAKRQETKKPKSPERAEPISRSIDARGMYCPIPVYKIRQAVLEAESGQVVELFADDPAAEEDITRWAQRTGNTVVKLEKSGDSIRFLIKKTER
jgi:tRNA 2-thiouridine synthesizing protein A